MNFEKTILVSGAGGFVGSFLIPFLRREFQLYGVPHRNFQEIVHTLPDSFYAIHLAGLAHNTNPSYQEFYSANVLFTKEFLQICREKNVQHIIYISTVKVLGEGQDSPYTEKSIPCPRDSYGKTKLEAEELVRNFSKKHNLKYTIIRPPLIYGPNPKGNIRSLVKLIQKQIPIPVPSQKNQRSIISVRNFSHLVERILQHPNSHNQTFVAQDPEPVSTKQLVSYISEAVSKQCICLPIPEKLGRFLFSLIGKKEVWKRLAGSLYVDDSFTRKMLDWHPPYSTRESIQEVIHSTNWFKA